MRNAVRIEVATREDCRIYHLRVELTEQPLESSENPESGELCRTVGRMRGVAVCYVRRYSVQVIKSPAFLWTEVEPAILEFLAAFRDAR